MTMVDYPGPDPTAVPPEFFADPLPHYPPDMAFLGDSALFLAETGALAGTAAITTITQADVVNISHYDARTIHALVMTLGAMLDGTGGALRPGLSRDRDGWVYWVRETRPFLSESFRVACVEHSAFGPLVTVTRSRFLTDDVVMRGTVHDAIAWGAALVAAYLETLRAPPIL